MNDNDNAELDIKCPCGYEAGINTGDWIISYGDAGGVIKCPKCRRQEDI